MKSAGLRVDQQSVKDKLDQLSSIIVKNVLDSNWVPGVREYIYTNPFNQNLYVASATPGKELEYICKQSNIFESWSRKKFRRTKKYIVFLMRFDLRNTMGTLQKLEKHYTSLNPWNSQKNAAGSAPFFRQAKQQVD